MEKAYLKRSKNDANDAAAICEAVTRPSMRFVAIKTKGAVGRPDAAAGAAIFGASAHDGE
jgi:transposase